MSSNETDMAKAILACLIGGPAALTWGLLKLHQRRLIQNTPSSKVRSAAMGLVEFSGTARARKPMTAPVSGVSCCWWHCKVQENRQSGKNSRWVTIQEVNSPELFFLEDNTGRALVDPFGAELHVPEHTYDMSGATKQALISALEKWNISTTSWLSLDRRMRIIEQVIPELSPLLVLGNLMSFQGHLEDRQQRLTERMRGLRANAARMAEGDLNKDGSIDAQEWDALRKREEEAFMKEELARGGATASTTHLLVRAPADHPFVVSCITESELLKAFAWKTPLAVIAGIGLSGLGVYLATREQWPFLASAGLLAIGFFLAYVTQRKRGLKTWLSLS